MIAVALFDASGRLLEISREAWAAGLELAISNGWTPAGSTTPPRSWGVSGGIAGTSIWDGRYVEPLGQCVTAVDAERMGQALAQGLEQGCNGELVRLADFARAGGFIVCALTAELRSALGAMPQGAVGDPERVGAQLENLRKSLGSSIAPEVVRADSEVNKG